jgi:hypothetical protein
VVGQLPAGHSVDELGRVVQVRCEHVPDRRVDGKVLHRTVTADEEHDVVAAGFDVFQLHRRTQDGVQVLEERLLTGDEARVVVVVRQRS